MTGFFPNRENTADPLLERLRASTVGLYEVAGEIGRGGMAAVSHRDRHAPGTQSGHQGHGAAS